jgi:hypothetical protein
MLNPEHVVGRAERCSARLQSCSARVYCKPVLLALANRDRARGADRRRAEVGRSNSDEQRYARANSVRPRSHRKTG